MVGGAAAGARLLLILLVACGQPDGTRPARASDRLAEQRLVGTWEASFHLDPRGSVARVGDTTTEVRGVLAFTSSDHRPTSIAGLGRVTNEGAYDLDFSPFRFTTPSDGPAVAVARVIPGVRADSLEIVLSPGTDRFAVHMAGHLTNDSASGGWIAYGYAAGGGTGRFTMWRRAAPR